MGVNCWFYLNYQGELVVVIFDSELLGVLLIVYYQNMGGVCSINEGIEYLDCNFSISFVQ